MGVQDGIVLLLAGFCVLYILRKLLRPLLVAGKDSACGRGCGCDDAARAGCGIPREVEGRKEALVKLSG